METRKESLSTLKLCRFCLSQSDNTLTSLYEKCRAPKTSVTLPLKILSCFSIEVFPSDKMPTYICHRCKFFMDISYEFKHMCRQADKHILQYVQNGLPLSPMSWPQSLLKLFRMANKPPEVAVMKTVIEGGATIQVTAQESDSDEEDDENVYNVKIGDGSDEGLKSARVKVITSADQHDKGKPKRGKGFASAAKLSKHVRTHAGDRSYPCKFCSKSFVKSHHYTRHLRLKHRENIRTCRGPFGELDQYRCEQCEDSFATQDELIYHSAIHATENLVCPLCQERFEDVDAVTTHIRSHVNGMEFMCELCELVFTNQAKLDTHMAAMHDDELQSVPDLCQDESSMEMDADEDDDDNGINVKELDDHMVVEIKKADDYMLSNSQIDAEDKIDNTNSEESDQDVTFSEIRNVDMLGMAKARKSSFENAAAILSTTGVSITKNPATQAKNTQIESQTASILRKAEEVKKKVIQQPTPEPIAEKKDKTNNNTGASDKSLRLLEKELQELKRTNTRSEAVKTPAKPIETLRSRRAQIHTSTPKPKPAATEEKKTPVVVKSPAVEKKLPERRAVTKENKEPKESKETKQNNVSAKEEKEKEKEVKESPKNVVKNGNNDKANPDEGSVRRSTRPSKIKDYAKMIRDRSQDSDDNEESEDSDDDEYINRQAEKSMEIKPRGRRSSVKTPAPKVLNTAVTPTPRKRGRPRKEPAVAPKVRKEQSDDDVTETTENIEIEKDNQPKTAAAVEKQETSENEGDTSATEQKADSGVLVSPSGQTLKKVPIKSLPPGVKPMPLPLNARPMGGGEVCEMQIGKKVVKVQKIVMTKAEVEAMAKKGLVEMKDGTMVLKQGIKLPTPDSSGLKPNLVDDIGKESPSKKDKAAPSRCDFGEDA